MQLKEKVLQAIRICDDRDDNRTCHTCPYGEYGVDCLTYLLRDAYEVITEGEDDEE